MKTKKIPISGFFFSAVYIMLPRFIPSALTGFNDQKVKNPQENQKGEILSLLNERLSSASQQENCVSPPGRNRNRGKVRVSVSTRLRISKDQIDCRVL